MKTIKSTRFSQVAKELEGIEKGLSKQVKEEINHADRKHHHVVLVKVTDRPGQVKNKVSVSVQMYAKHGWEKIQKSFKFLGFTKIALLHDPALLEEKDEVIIPAHQKAAIVREEKSKAQKEMDDEVEKRVEARLKEEREKREAADKLKEETNKKGEKKDPPKELTEDEKVEAMTEDFTKAMAGNKPELETFLNKYGIPSGDLTNNEGRKQRIKKWYETEMEKIEAAKEGEATDGDGGTENAGDGTQGDDNGTNGGDGSDGGQGEGGEATDDAKE